MKRLVVTNSALAYPRVPEAVLRPGDLVLPLVERLDDALFMPGEWYEDLRASFPAFNLETRQLARSMGELLPEWLGGANPEWGHSAWDAYCDHFVRFSLGPLLCNHTLARRAASGQPSEVVAWETPSDLGWWTGRQMVAEVAEWIGAQADAPVRLTSSAARRIARELSFPALPIPQVLRLLERYGRLAGNCDLPRADVLFAVLGPTLVPLFDRIAAQLQHSHGLSAVALDLPAGLPGADITPGRLPRYGLHSLVEPGMVRAGVMEALAAPRAAASVAAQLADFPPLSDLSEPLRGVLTRRLHAGITREMTLVMLHARLWRRALDMVRPSVVVSFVSYNDLMAPVILQARHRGIRTVGIQHGVWGPPFRAGALLPYDELMVFGEYSEQIMRPLAPAEAGITRTGHSVYDGLSTVPPPPAAREALADGRRYLVLVTTQPIEASLRAHEPRWWLEALAEACEACDARMLIKPHPCEDGNLYLPLRERWPRHVGIAPPAQGEVGALIGASDVMVTRFSTTAFEAALLDTPVMTVNLGGGPDRYPFTEDGAAVGVHSEEDLLPTLRRLLTDTSLKAELRASRQSFVARHVGPTDGRATERIAARIAQQAGL